MTHSPTKPHLFHRATPSDSATPYELGGGAFPFVLYILFKFVFYVHWHFAYMYACVQGLGPLELEFQTVVCSHVGAWN